MIIHRWRFFNIKNLFCFVKFCYFCIMTISFDYYNKKYRITTYAAPYNTDIKCFTNNGKLCPVRT